MVLRVLTWNVFHGRALPPRNQDLLVAFAARLSAWPWDVALLQEVPPWWPERLARACDAEQRRALTSRNALLPLRRALARPRPELMKAKGGGANAILVRRLGIAAHERRRVRTWPERRVVHAVRDGDGRWFANLHASVHDDARAHADVARARAAVLRWAGDAPAVLGGDLNVRDPYVSGFVHAGGHEVDHVFARGLEPAGRCETLDRGTLSDHAPVLVTVSD
ncbi:MAG TPA: endonuclease/exonuclease/phosphatase family protein [Conexibacter sp.]|jgi:endonuclease/exonuclease/phosphatase family metal-dependent hydrolase|nr:endonuclease/exonuclease/phosphatase family protein [Conexibacter sp.]